MLRISSILKAFTILVLAVFFGILSARNIYAATFSLSGKITESSGNPIVEAIVGVNDVNTSINVASTTSDNAGNYSETVNGGTYNVQVTPRSGSSFSSAIAPSRTISSDTVINFILVPAGSVSLSGHVFDPLGNPLPNQQVFLTLPDSGTRLVTTTTDISGNYSLEVSPGSYDLHVFTNNNNFSLNAPQIYELIAPYSLTQSTVLDITIPARKVDLHVQDTSSNPVSNVKISTPFGSGGNFSIGGSITNAYGYSHYGNSFSKPETDTSGNLTLWLFPNTSAGVPYTIVAIPPSGSIYAQFTLNNVSILSDQTEIISLQFVHDAPVTMATLSPAANSQGEYSDPVTVTLSATAAVGFTTANTYYAIEGGSQQTYTSTFTVSGDGSHTITYWSIDNVGVFESPNTKTFTIHVNQPPAISSLSNITINEGDTYPATGSFTDHDSTSWTATVDYGDGSGSQSLNLNPDKTFALSHTYKDNGNYTVTVSITDNQGAIGTATATITVNNSNPSVGTITAPTTPQQVNTPITASAPFTDPGVLDTHTAVWNWGDGTTSSGTVTDSGGSGSVSNTHTYTAAGVYTITLTVTDNNGGSGASTFQYVVVYDPSAGYVTGGGTITSPLGAYTQDPTLSGKAVFGFVSKYQKGANLPTGNTEFQFKFANFNFHSTSYDWLVVGGARAQYKGSGTVNGNGDYRFLLTAIDGQINGGGGTDKFRIKIADKTMGNVVYDNQLGAYDTSDPITVIDSGSITIHH